MLNDTSYTACTDCDSCGDIKMVDPNTSFCQSCTETESRVFKIPSHNYPSLEAQIVKLNKKADKLGQPHIKLSKLSEFVEDKKRYTTIRVDGKTPVIEGWRILASIEYIGTGTIIKSPIQGFKAPKYVVNGKPFCEHCNTHRVKKYTVLIQNVETHEYMNVGKTCLKDFFTKDINAEVASYSYFSEIINELSNPDSEYYGGYAEPVFPVEQLLAIAHTDIKENGYKPVAWEDESTASYVGFILFDKDAPRIKLTEENEQFAQDVIEWVKNNDSDSDFMTNVKNLVALGDIEYKHFRLLIGACGGYLGMKKREAQKAEILDEHFGEIKKRYTLELTITFKTSFEGYYGAQYLHCFTDKDGRQFTWKGAKQLRDFPTEGNFTGEAFQVGDKVKVKGTVTGHEIYRDKKQTKLTRLTLVK